MNCNHWINRTRCTSEATMKLYASDGEAVPGGFYCERHATEIIDEYREKLSETWTAHKIQGPDDLKILAESALSLLQQMRTEAIDYASARGHSMEWLKPSTYQIKMRERILVRAMQSGFCRDCERTISLDTRPLPNATQIGGEALAINCNDPKGGE